MHQSGKGERRRLRVGRASKWSAGHPLPPMRRRVAERPKNMTCKKNHLLKKLSPQLRSVLPCYRLSRAAASSDPATAAVGGGMARGAGGRRVSCCVVLVYQSQGSPVKSRRGSLARELGSKQQETDTLSQSDETATSPCASTGKSFSQTRVVR